MRTIRYYIVNKNTNEAIFTDCRRKACEQTLAKMADKENYTIGYKWLSI
jgi:hypothetical protein